ncbi:MAG: MBL fold metallo-hydrolase [Myxococcota bacterium]|nr:MBL fold metallo-hydrolase [Myxococcota bacterium]
MLALLLTGALLGGCVFSAPRYRGPVSDHFDGEAFHNPPGVPDHGFSEVLRWQRERQPGEWRDFAEAPPGPAPVPWVGDGRMRVTFVNHATVLVQMDGLNILTDPIWSDRCSPVPFAGPHRVRPPGIRFEDLPAIDVILISHNHYDHLDLPTLRRLVHAFPQVKIFAGLGVGLLLTREGLHGSVELDWWQERPLAEGVKVIAVPVQHFSGRGLTDRNATLWTGFSVKGPSGSLYLAGDTGYGPHFQAVRERLGSPRLALLPIGAYLPQWFMSPVHINPEEALRAHTDLGAGTSVAIHFGTFPLADDGQDQPVRELERALAGNAELRSRFWVLGFGEGREVPPL